ncbi:MAG: hypothetical protein AAB373_00885 [Patescibacteria group bacterium]
MRTTETKTSTTTELTGLNRIAADSLRNAPDFAEKEGYISGLGEAWGIKLDAARIIAAIQANPSLMVAQTAGQVGKTMQQ